MPNTDKKPHINVDYFENLTGEISETSQTPFEEVGARIRSLREQKGISPEELSKLTGFGVDVLAGIEAGTEQPQLGTIIKLSKALDTALGRLVSGVGEKLFSITRKDEQKPVMRSTADKGKKKLYTYRSLASDVKGRHMEALIVQLEEKVEESDSVHEGEEFIYVLDGVVSLRIGNEEFELTPGDSAYYLSTTPHLLAAKKDKAKIIAVIYAQ